MKNRPSLPILSVLILMLGLGTLSVWWSHRQSQGHAEEFTSTQLPSGEAGPRLTSQNGSRMILILGVDDLQSHPATLVAVWLANSRISNKEVLLIGYPIDAVAPLQGQSLQQLFRYNPEQGIAPGFIEAVQNLAVVSSIDLIVMLDEVMFASLVNYVGGVQLDDGWLSGQDCVAIQRLFYDDGSHLVRTQQRILQELRLQLNGIAGSFDITSLVLLSREHAFLPVDPAQLALWAAPFLPVDPKNIRVEIASSTLPSQSAYVLP